MAAGFAGCAREPAIAAARSVQFFRDHPDELKATLAECRSQQTESVDCQNAATAGLVNAQHRDIPTVHFPRAPAK
jgi:hypothetical protein